MSILKLSETKFKVNLWFFEAETTWDVSQPQRKASWEMYVELVTRITTVPLHQNEGLLREALSSYYSLFETTRAILKKYGPEIAKANNPGDTTFGHIAVKVLNTEVRPILAKWHPRLTDWENQRIPTKSTFEHEQDWELNSELRDEIEKTRLKLVEYAEVMGIVSDVADLM